MDLERLPTADDLEVGEPGGPSQGLQVSLQGLEPLRRRRRPVVEDVRVRGRQDVQIALDTEGIVGQLVGSIGDQTGSEK